MGNRSETVMCVVCAVAGFVAGAVTILGVTKREEIDRVMEDGYQRILGDVHDRANQLEREVSKHVDNMGKVVDRIEQSLT